MFNFFNGLNRNSQSFNPKEISRDRHSKNRRINQKEKIECDRLLVEENAKEVLIKLLSELQELHSLGIIHHNISPNNIIGNSLDYSTVFLNSCPPPISKGDVILSVKRNPNLCLTLDTDFIAPEEATGNPIFASDIYALGLTVIYLLTGKMPKQLKFDLATGNMIWHQYADRISPQLVAIIDRAIQPHPSDRYANAGEMLMEVKSLLPPSSSSKRLSSSPWTTTLISYGIAVMGVLAIFIASYSQQRPQRSLKSPIATPLPVQPALSTTDRPNLQPNPTPLNSPPSPEPKPIPSPPPITYLPPSSAIDYLDLTIANKASWRGKMPSRSVVLTFDDGPSREYTPQVLAILQKHNIKATFFVVGKRVERDCDLVLQIVIQGHELGNHTYDRPFLWNNPASFQYQQIEKGQQAINNCLQKFYSPEYSSLWMPKWFRAPYAAQDRTTLNVAHQLGLHRVMWSMDTRDWHRSTSVDSIVREVTQTQGQDIVLMHDATETDFEFHHPEASLSRDRTVAALDEAIARLKARGIEFLTLSEAFDLQN